MSNLPILVSRHTWMETYATHEEKGISNHGYIKKGETPYECLNFLDCSGKFYGYVRLDGDLNINRLGAKSSDTQIKGVLVILTATHPEEGGLRVVGFYKNATVYRKKQPIDADPAIFTGDTSIPEAGKGKRAYRFCANVEDCKLLPIEERMIILPPRNEGGMGQTDVWYGLMEKQKHTALRTELIDFCNNYEIGKNFHNTKTENIGSSGGIVERVTIRRHKNLERQTQARRFIFEKGFKCEACGLALEKFNQEQQEAWQSSFEVHHLKPLANLAVGEERITSESDVAILCANCHRAIHRTDFIGDLSAFRKFSGFE